MQDFTVSIGTMILEGLTKAPDSQLDTRFKDEVVEFIRQPRSAVDMWNFLRKFKRDIEFNDACSAFVHTLIDVERFYNPPTE